MEPSCRAPDGVLPTALGADVLVAESNGAQCVSEADWWTVMWAATDVVMNQRYYNRFVLLGMEGQGGVLSAYVYAWVPSIPSNDRHQTVRADAAYSAVL